MKKTIYSALTATAALGAISVPSAGAATTDPSPMYQHLGSNYSTQAQCQSAANSNQSAVKSAGGSIVTGAYSARNNGCDLGAQGWTYSTSYTRAAGAMSGDVRVDKAGISAATAQTIGGRRVAYFTHEYTFADRKSCMNAYNGIMAKLKSLPNTVKVVAPNTADSDPLPKRNNTFACRDEFEGESTQPYIYRIAYQSRTDMKAPYGYERVESMPLDPMHSNTGWVYDEGKTLPDGTYKQTGTFTY